MFLRHVPVIGRLIRIEEKLDALLIEINILKRALVTPAPGPAKPYQPLKPLKPLEHR